ncbi:dihydroorotate dehydrogenase [Fervidobacterium thailandense]|uniref:dihydroorotate dehydrogenase n=1 Tax=Fervidobacterium thailandense TaxID=1008305 RepID=UPI001F4E6DAF|nr:dihydroorotate dehydrogenase [Fervidobacterium thailandense]
MDNSVNREGRLELSVPVIIASGPAGFGEYGKLEDFPWQDVGAFTLKTVTFKKKEGNKPPRMYAKDGYVINRIGLENPGIHEFLEVLQAGEFDWLFEKTSVILSLGGDSFEEYVEISKLIKPYANRFKAIEYNFSCPNVKHGGLSIIANKDEWIKLLYEIRTVLDEEFLIAKLGIEGGFVEHQAKIVSEAGWDGVTVINTVRGLMFNDEGEMIVGGLSGPNLLPIALRAVFEVRKMNPELYIIASGGIYTGDDAIKMLKVGADAVSVGSLLFKNEKMISQIANRVREYLGNSN